MNILGVVSSVLLATMIGFLGGMYVATYVLAKEYKCRLRQLYQEWHSRDNTKEETLTVYACTRSEITGFCLASEPCPGCETPGIEPFIDEDDHNRHISHVPQKRLEEARRIWGA